MRDALFGAYAKHEQEKREIIQMMIADLREGNTYFSYEFDDDFSEEEIAEMIKTAKSIYNEWRYK